MSYTVSPQAKDKNGNSLYLTDTYPGDVTVTNQSGNGYAQTQLWQPLWVPINQGVGGVILKNKGTGRLIAVPEGNNPALTEPDTPQYRTQLNWPSAILQTVSTNPANYFVIRGLQDQDNNLNVKGDPPYSNGDQVLFWTWGGGQSNEIWTFNYIQD